MAFDLQWDRRIELVVGNDSGQGLDLSDMHIIWSVRHPIVSTPKALAARVYNLSESTAQRIKTEFTRVILQAGYQNAQYGPIFDGTIKQIRRGHENATDSYVDIFAADGDQAYNFAVTNTTLAAGYTPKDQIRAVGKAMSFYGVDVAQTDSAVNLLPDTPAPRGRVMFGMARDFAEEAARTNGMVWNLRDGGLYLYTDAPLVPEERTAIVLTSATGLIGFPEQTQDGIAMRCLLNPNIHTGTLIKIDNASVNEAALPLAWNTVPNLPSIADDGFYEVIWKDHVGDTRGQAWYTEMVCRSLTGVQPITPAVSQNIPD